MRFSATMLTALVWLSMCSPVEAQTAFFPDERSVGGVKGFWQRYQYEDDGGEEQSRILGAEVEMPVSPRLSFSFGGGSTPDLGGSRRVRTVSAGLSYFASRQSETQVLTAELDLGFGYLGGERVPTGPALTIGVAFSHTFGQKSGLRLKPSITGTTNFLFLGEYRGSGGFANRQALTTGLGLGIAPTPRVVLFVEPGVTLSFGEGDQPSVFGVAAGFGFAY